MTIGGGVCVSLCACGCACMCERAYLLEGGHNALHDELRSLGQLGSHHSHHSGIHRAELRSIFLRIHQCPSQQATTAHEIESKQLRQNGVYVLDGGLFRHIVQRIAQSVEGIVLRFVPRRTRGELTS